mmetsp:Transcript_21436/g.63466  ORF Transcript_21436/g.63466 Transcript_21436/m.63466 type:complete len:210 (-) Transcript_21436:9-638(-)
MGVLRREVGGAAVAPTNAARPGPQARREEACAAGPSRTPCNRAPSPGTAALAAVAAARGCRAANRGSPAAGGGKPHATDARAAVLRPHVGPRGGSGRRRWGGRGDGRRVFPHGGGPRGVVGAERRGDELPDSPHEQQRPPLFLGCSEWQAGARRPAAGSAAQAAHRLGLVVSMVVSAFFLFSFECLAFECPVLWSAREFRPNISFFWGL